MYGDNRGSFSSGGFTDSSPVEAGKTYEVEIEDISRQGDGIARVEGFVIFVSDTKVGDKVTISVDRVMRRFAIAHKV
ncbi:TRAM domain-containing protein [Methanotrichaceae archaeon M04Ac]|uniref:TRAM domain-containing protein n=1 Tax=Candidatus Methanocrinis alkalitolerans TaxID=3033395 RepID=A0ABT5XCY0_9EURY|nr:TRAM domain-containing protein [Candidatus Methanocrinis alkalitolerans]MCR3882924.1 TRAM domain-containing protein [Methanothrix sp.]MDF0592568.1 TRAM domain-containing protein [Candidatus Methanocrinis alkalitolerans]